ncbi:short-chain dehydrogenase [Helicobacter enhydrae]|uniref:Short-chain dehydrogenase n=1 Tax=Helicobacter enhydrae TaxID=222136 RepID=A0A1B1U5D4_9HELI|nr:SDR family oxidoreductase [Helicobacter enhydrae]ANV98007.1 short-chain dehydrogenase [Helicobacter enhydrae]
MYRFDFTGKQILISGASSGMGAHVAYVLNAMGAKILAIARDINKLQTKKESMPNPQNFICISKDITQINAFDKEILEIIKKYGSVNGAVLSAGIQQIAPISSVLSVESALTLFHTNYFGNLQILKALIDRRAKTPEGSSFVIISSNSSVKAQKGLANYSATKSAINTAIKSIALEIAPKYTINAISPGFVMTEMIEEWSKVYDEAYIQQITKEYPLGLGKVEQISPLICFLLSPYSNWITGQNIVIDGGASL